MNTSLASSWPRLAKRLARAGVTAERHGNVWRLRRDQTEAQLLLPAEFPLELKAVGQLLDFAGVGWPCLLYTSRCV